MNLRYVFMLGFILSTNVCKSDEKILEPLDDSDSPNILYVVPWVDAPEQKTQAPKLVIHDLMKDLYEPQLPEEDE
jgi:hypothetical protein